MSVKMTVAYRVLLAVAVIVVGIPALYCLTAISSLLWVARDRQLPFEDVLVQSAVVLGLCILVTKARSMAADGRLGSAITLLAVLDVLMIVFLAFIFLLVTMFWNVP